MRIPQNISEPLTGLFKENGFWYKGNGRIWDVWDKCLTQKYPYLALFTLGENQVKSPSKVESCKSEMPKGGSVL